MRPRRGRLLAAAAVALVTAPAVSAVSARSAEAAEPPTATYVSVTGDDGSACIRATPCRTFARAIAAAATGAVVSALDDGDFGPFTIDRAVTVDGGGHAASVSAPGADGVVVDAPEGSDVVLRDLHVTAPYVDPNRCSGHTGVQVVGARTLRLDDVAVSGFTRAVGTPLTHSSLDIYVDLSFNGLDVYNNCEYGLRIDPDAGHAGRATIDGTTITGSNVALSVVGGGEAWVSDSNFYLNNVGVQADGGRIHSLCGNEIAGNASDGTFTDQAGCGLPPTPAPTPAPPPSPAPLQSAAPPAYCTVPRLRGRTVRQAGTLLGSAGCTLGKVTKRVAGARQRNRVVAQGIPAGVEVRPGTRVRVLVGR